MSPPSLHREAGQKYDKSVYYQSKALAKVHDMVTKLVQAESTSKCKVIIDC